VAESITNYVAIVDDDNGVARALSRLLRASGLQPVAYPSAEAFLADVKRPQFDCLVLDVRLGGMSGIELARRLDAVGSMTPVVFITAHDEAELREEAAPLHCVAYLRKSDPAEAVLAAIRRAVKEGAASPSTVVTR
jgi:FixJ family two-component response regulator